MIAKLQPVKLMKPKLTPEEIAYIVSVPAWLPKHRGVTYFKVTQYRIKIYCYINRIKYSMSYRKPSNLFNNIIWGCLFELGDLDG